MASPGAFSNSDGGVRGCKRFKKPAAQKHISAQIQNWMTHEVQTTATVRKWEGANTGAWRPGCCRPAPPPQAGRLIATQRHRSESLQCGQQCPHFCFSVEPALPFPQKQFPSRPASSFRLFLADHDTNLHATAIQLGVPTDHTSNSNHEQPRRYAYNVIIGRASHCLP